MEGVCDLGGGAMHLQAVFLDRDGTLGGDGHFCHPKDFVPYPWTAPAIEVLRILRVKIFGLTNQPRISAGEAAEQDFAEEFARLGCDGAYVCPHALDADCACRKPRPGLLVRAAQVHDLDLTRCAVIGDVGATDMLAASQVGALKILVKTGWGVGSLTDYRHCWVDVRPDYVAQDVLDAAHWLRRAGATAPAPRVRPGPSGALRAIEGDGGPGPVGERICGS